MKTLSSSGLALLLALCHPAASADNYCRAACTATINEGLALEGQDKFAQAAGKYQEAAKAEPLASLPISMEAAMALSLSGRVKPEEAEKFRQHARTLADRALRLASDDPLAQEVLRKLDDDDPASLHAANQAARAPLLEAERLFTQQQFDAARAQYEAAAQADPQLSEAWLGAGDCYFNQKDWPHAAALFQRAVDIEPRNSRAWRYLADALVMQGKGGAAENALYSAIAADPSQRPNWGKLSSLRTGAPLQALQWRRVQSGQRGADGQFEIRLDLPAAYEKSRPDMLVRTVLGTTTASLREADTAHAKTSYEIELAAWRAALKLADGLQAKSGERVSDPALRRMQEFARDGQLEPAILLLQFRQSYRPALEAWLAAHPDGVRKFVERYGVQP